MSKYICLDSSVLIKVFVEEEDSNKALHLINNIIEQKQLIVLPAFACLEIGTVLLKKQRKGLSLHDAGDIWLKLRSFPGIEYLEDETLLDLAWTISRSLEMPTLYDAAFLAAAELIALTTGEICEFWTADERLCNLLNGRKEYIRLLKAL